MRLCALKVRSSADVGGWHPPSDTNRLPTVRLKIDLGAHRSCLWVIGQVEAELAVTSSLCSGSASRIAVTRSPSSSMIAVICSWAGWVASLLSR